MSEFRRCFWCARRLRWWQWKYCRVCHHHFTGISFDHSHLFPTYAHNSQQNAEPDRWRKTHT